MKIIIGIGVTLLCSYLLINWAGDNPRDARKVTKKVDDAAYTLVDKGQRAVTEISQ